MAWVGWEIDSVTIIIYVICVVFMSDTHFVKIWRCSTINTIKYLFFSSSFFLIQFISFHNIGSIIENLHINQIYAYWKAKPKKRRKNESKWKENSACAECCIQQLSAGLLFSFFQTKSKVFNNINFNRNNRHSLLRIWYMRQPFSIWSNSIHAKVDHQLKIKLAQL